MSDKLLIGNHASSLNWRTSSVHWQNWQVGWCKDQRMLRRDHEPLYSAFAMASAHVLNGNHAKEAGTHGRFFEGLIKTIGNFLW